jgi:hypothetical protein
MGFRSIPLDTAWREKKMAHERVKRSDESRKLQHLRDPGWAASRLKFFDGPVREGQYRYASARR